MDVTLGDGGQVEFGSVLGRVRPDGPNRMQFSFVLGVFVFFLRPAELGGGGSGSPAKIDLGRDMVKGGKVVAAAG